MVIITYVALGIFLLLGSLNLYFVVRNSTAAGQNELLRSTVPLVGGIAGIIGFMSVDALRPYAWAPLILDVGSAGFLVSTLPRMAKERWQFSSFNLMREYRATGDAAKTGTLRLYKSGVFVLRLDFHRRENELGISQFTRVGTWQETAAGLKLATRDGKSAELGRQAGGQPAALGVTIDFPTFQTDAELALTGLVFNEVADGA